MHHHSVSHNTNGLLFKVWYFLSLAIKCTFILSDNKQRSTNRSISTAKRSFLSSGKKENSRCQLFFYLWESLTQNVSSTMVCCGPTSHHRCLFYPRPVGRKKKNMKTTEEAFKTQMNSVMFCVGINERKQPNLYLSFQGVLAGWRGWPKGEGASGFSLLNRYPPVEAGVACGPPALADDVRAAAADQPVWERVALFVVFQISLGQAVGHVERVADVLPQHASLRDGRIWRRMSRPGVVHFRPHYSSSWGALEEYRKKIFNWWNSSKYPFIVFNTTKSSRPHSFLLFPLSVFKRYWWSSSQKTSLPKE